MPDYSWPKIHATKTKHRPVVGCKLYSSTIGIKDGTMHTLLKLMPIKAHTALSQDYNEEREQREARLVEKAVQAKEARQTDKTSILEPAGWKEVRLGFERLNGLSEQQAENNRSTKTARLVKERAKQQAKKAPLAEEQGFFEEQQAEEARIAKERAEAFACRPCSASFPSDIKFHNHVQDHHQKKPAELAKATQSEPVETTPNAVPAPIPTPSLDRVRSPTRPIPTPSLDRVRSPPRSQQSQSLHLLQLLHQLSQH